MYGENVCPNAQEPPDLPALGALMVDTARGDRVGEFRGSPAPAGRCGPLAAGPSGRPSLTGSGPRSS